MSSSAKTWHPDREQLAAFAQGRLPLAPRKPVQAHLDQCATCRAVLAALPGNAGSMSGHDTLSPGAAAKGATVPRLDATAGDRPGSLAPADLADHPRYE